MKKILLKGRLLAVPLLSFCFLTAFIFSSYEEMREVDCFSPYLNLEGQNQSTLAFVEKIKLNPALLDSDSHIRTRGVLKQLPGLFSPISHPQHIPNPLRC